MNIIVSEVTENHKTLRSLRLSLDHEISIAIGNATSDAIGKAIGKAMGNAIGNLGIRSTMA